ncbi:MAG: hypothetical protein LBR38_06235 [Synergistaceae bacterium]|jgi:hypothetical protein|nr:hypothetical protein [Synergistaceae bacterium]
MLQPVNLQLSHLSVEHTAQTSRDALAAAQQTGQGQTIAEESIRRAQRVEAGLAAAAANKIKRREEGEEKGEEKQRRNSKEGQKHPLAGGGDQTEAPKLPQAGGVEFYA